MSMAGTKCTGNYFYNMNDKMMTIKTVHVQETTIELTLIKMMSIAKKLQVQATPLESLVTKRYLW